MSISQLAREIAESPTLKLNEEAQDLRDRGEAVIHLGAGEPKTKIPFEAMLSTAAQLATAEVRYTPTEGIGSLRKAILRYMEENYFKVLGKDNVIVSNGAKQALSAVLTTIINPLDEVIIIAPYGVSYPEMVKMVYAKPVIVTPGDGRFQPELDDVTDMVSSYTKAIIINSPNNPSGAVYSADFIGSLVEYCEKKGIYLIMDDIYHKLVSPPAQWTPCYKYSQVDPNQSKLIVINGVSKLYAMTGYRIGWTIASKQIVDTMVNVQAQTTSCPPLLSQVAAVGALTGLQSGVESLRLTLENNRKVMVQELNAFEGVKLIPPDGTFYSLPDFRAYSNDSVKLSKMLLEKVYVVAVPGKEFGMEGHLRLSYCTSVKDIMEGIARIKWALDPNSPNEIYIGDRKLVRDWK
ncbi:MAG: aminotransferase class I/II-fold pyridoxal phosphate-dependent enzyme [Candidatus Zixiibacteriota bacterium]|nr:MAG: aminotransferase class I/II-fold pyridoxal phosphate-dependent enzyme [candidate division Zixibacteria bacterium]